MYLGSQCQAGDRTRLHSGVWIDAGCFQWATPSMFCLRKYKVALMGRQRAKNWGQPTGLDEDGRWASGKAPLHMSSLSHPAFKEEAPRWSCDGFPHLSSLCPWSAPTSSRRRKQEQWRQDNVPFSHHLGTGDASFWTSLCLQRWGNSLALNSQFYTG